MKKKKLQWNLKQILHNFIQENTFANVNCEMATILPRPDSVKLWRNNEEYLADDTTQNLKTQDVVIKKKYPFSIYPTNTQLCICPRLGCVIDRVPGDLENGRLMAIRFGHLPILKCHFQSLEWVDPKCLSTDTKFKKPRVKQLLFRVITTVSQMK